MNFAGISATAEDGKLCAPARGSAPYEGPDHFHRLRRYRELLSGRPRSCEPRTVPAQRCGRVVWAASLNTAQSASGGSLAPLPAQQLTSLAGKSAEGCCSLRCLTENEPQLLSSDTRLYPKHRRPILRSGGRRSWLFSPGFCSSKAGPRAGARPTSPGGGGKPTDQQEGKKE